MQEQSGIQAGDGGLQIKVAGNTDLKGGAIGSTVAGAAASSLTTATLTQSDIANHATMEASSVGVSGSATSGGSDDGKYNEEGGKGQGPGGKNLINEGATGKSAGLPGIAATSDSDASTTRSGIGAGTLVITDDAAQRAATGKGAQESVAATNRDVTTGVDTSGRIGNNFDLAATQATLSVTSAFTAAAAPLAANLVGDVAQAKQDEAQRAADKYAALADAASKSGDTEAKKAYKAQAADAQATASAWSDNGANRIALHAAAQGLIGGLAGGGAGALSSVSGVAGGNVGQQLGKALGEAEADKLGLKKEGPEREALINTYQQTLSSVGGAVAGLAASSASGQGGMSAVANTLQASSTATAVDVYNRQLHVSDATLIRNNAAKYAALRGGISVDQAIAELSEQALRQVDSSWAARTTDNPAASGFLRQLAQSSPGMGDLGGGSLFDARGTASFTDHTINIGSLPKTADLYNTLNSTNLKGIPPRVRGSYVAINDAAADSHVAGKNTATYNTVLGVGNLLQSQAQTADEFLAINASRLSLAAVGGNQGGIKPGTPTGDKLMVGSAQALLTGLPSDGGKPIGPKVGGNANVGGDGGKIGVTIANTKGANNAAEVAAVDSAATNATGKLSNIFPSDPAMPGPRYKLVQTELGDFKYQLPSGELRTAKGAYDFIKIGDEIKIAPPRNDEFSGHLSLSKGADVDYAGTIQFSQKGGLKWWDNDSGHYQPLPGNFSVVKLPANLFKPVHE